MTVTADTPHQAEHASRRYYFCSAHCVAQFSADPERYVRPHAGQTHRAQNSHQTHRHASHEDHLAHRVHARTSASAARSAPAGTDPPVARQRPICGSRLGRDADIDEGPHPGRDFRRRFWWTLPLTVAGVARALLSMRWQLIDPRVQPWIELALATPVVWWAGWPFFQRWRQSIVNRSPNMWTLIGTGVGIAYVYSAVATTAPGVFPASFHTGHGVAVYFEAAVVISPGAARSVASCARADVGGDKALLAPRPRTA
jgi:Cu+-exporting ATPase